MEYHKGRILEYLNEVNQNEWVEREINTVYDKAEALDAYKAALDAEINNKYDEWMKSDGGESWDLDNQIAGLKTAKEILDGIIKGE